MAVGLRPLAASQMVSALLTCAGDVVVDRLDRLGRDADWLAELGLRHSRLWEFERSHASTESPCDELLPLLLSWLAAPLRSEAAVLRDVNQAAREGVFNVWFGVVPEACGVPVGETVALYAGTVGRPASERDLFVPAWLPTEALPEDVHRAYAGLVEHVEQTAEPWAEVARSAMLWRLGGLSQGLLPGESLHATVLGLFAQMRGVDIPHTTRETRTSPWVSEFVGDRNAFTHLLAVTGGHPSFAEALERHPGFEETRVYISIATFFVAAAINERLQETPPEPALGWADALDRSTDWLAA